MNRPGGLGAIGGTPVVRLSRIVEPGMAEVWVKLEAANPTGSYKDRMALAMIEGAERSGRLQPGQTVVEYTGGSTGSSLAFVCSVKGYPLRIVSSDAFAVEKVKTMRAFGADVELIHSPEGITPTLIPSMQARAAEIAAEIGAYQTDQFNNTDMVEGYRALGEELLEQLAGRVDAIVIYVGTAGCYLGVTRALRDRLPAIHRVAVEPSESAVLSGRPPGTHRIEGGGTGFVPPQLSLDEVDEIVTVSTSDAQAMARRAARDEGVWSGPSSGANITAALAVARRLGSGARVATIQVDSGLKYLSGELYHLSGELGPLAWFAERPRLAALIGASCIAFSGVFYLYAAVSPSTGTFYRAIFGLPLLVLVALGERRRHGPLPPETIRLAAIAGVFFAGDLMFWHHAIEAVGAGLATVLGNLQVIIVGFFAWLLLGERPSRATLLALPVVLAGVILISGVVGSGAYGAAPQLGVILGIATAICYSAYLLIIRRGGRDPRRPAGPVAIATVLVAVCAFVIGQGTGELDLTPPLHSLFWLAALGITSQSAGYLLISISLPRLPAIITSVILLVQPVMSMGLAIVLLGEAPSPTQLLGVGLVIGGIAAATLPVGRLRDGWQRARPSPTSN